MSLEPIAEKIAHFEQLIDELEAPMPEHLHLHYIRETLPELVRELKDAYQDAVAAA